MVETSLVDEWYILRLHLKLGKMVKNQSFFLISKWHHTTGQVLVLGVEKHPAWFSYNCSNAVLPINGWATLHLFGQE